jgi:hypothetical protein
MHPKGVLVKINQRNFWPVWIKDFVDSWILFLTVPIRLSIFYLKSFVRPSVRPSVCALFLPKFIRDDGILLIGKFMLVIKNHFALFKLPDNLLKTKKIAPYFRGNTQFPIYLNSKFQLLHFTRLK